MWSLPVSLLLGALAAGGIIMAFLLRLVLSARPRGVDAAPLKNDRSELNCRSPVWPSRLRFRGMRLIRSSGDRSVRFMFPKERAASVSAFLPDRNTAIYTM